jgi:hypothetical protein
MPKLTLTALVAALSLCACGDKTADSGADTEAPAVDYEADVQDVFNRSCISCHNAAGTYKPALAVDLVLESGASYDELVGVDATQLPGMPLVDPGDSANSYLWYKLTDTHTSVGGSGDEMPPGLTLATNDLEPIQRWIDQGAAR